MRSLRRTVAILATVRLYHGHRLRVDLRHHHVFGAGINTIEAYRSSRAGLGRLSIG